MATSMNNQQPTLALTQAIMSQGIFPTREGSGETFTLGGIRTLAANFSPTGGTILTDGRLIPLAQNTALFSLLGINYGGNGTTNFAVPDLGETISISQGQGPGLASYFVGDQAGTDFISLLQSNLPTSFGGTSQPVDNRQQELTTQYAIVYEGIFPSQGGGGGALGLIGMVIQFAGNFAPGSSLPADGRLLAIADYDVLFQVIGTTYGGDGQTTFALPDLRGRSIIGSGNGFVVGQQVGSPTASLGLNNMPSFALPNLPVDTMAPGLVMTQLIALSGIFPSRDGGGLDYQTPTLSEIVAFAGDFAPSGWVRAQGQLLPINQNQALFSLLGTNYGGNGTTNFALPDLRGRAIVSATAAEPVGTISGSTTMTVALANLPAVNFTGTNGDERLLSGNENDVVRGSGGNDTVASKDGDDQLFGDDGNDILIGANGNDMLSGGNNNDTLLGQDGNDTLDAGAGNNELYGGLGDDTYVLVNSTDTIIELLNQGTDLVRISAASFTLPTNVENLTFTGIGAFSGTGNTLDNVITGGNGFNALSGGDGNDRIIGGSTPSELNGGAGNDTYVVSNYGDTFVESGIGGTDTVETALGNFILPGNLENLTYTGSGTFIGQGNALANVMIGGSGQDSFIGLDGADRMTGGGGVDRYFYQGGETGVDTITDFASGIDRIALSLSGFTKTPTYTLIQGVAPVAATAESTFLFNVGSRELSYDPDGNGVQAAIALAVLTGTSSLTVGDFSFY